MFETRPALYVGGCIIYLALCLFLRLSDCEAGLPYDKESMAIIHLNNTTVMYLKEVTKFLAMVCFLRRDSFERKGQSTVRLMAFMCTGEKDVRHTYQDNDHYWFDQANCPSLDTQLWQWMQLGELRGDANTSVSSVMFTKPQFDKMCCKYLQVCVL